MTALTYLSTDNFTLLYCTKIWYVTEEECGELVNTSANTAVGIRHADHVAPSIRKKVGTNFADKRRYARSV
jgi:hypothetical protein